MSKGAIVLSGVPTVIGGTLGQQVEHDQDKNIIIYGGSSVGIGSGILTNYANISHTHGTPTVIGSISVTSVSSGWTISIPAFLTTAALSNHIHGSINVVPIAGTSASFSSASSGLTIGMPAWITTAALSSHTHNYAGTGTTINGAGSDFFDVTLNSNGIVFDISAVPGGADGYNRIAAGTQTGTSVGTVVFSNSNGISFGMSGNTRVTASYSQSTHDHPYVNTNVSSAFLTTARSSNDALGLGTAQTNVTWTADSRGLSINAAGYAGTLTSGTNIGLSVNSLGISASIDTNGMTALGDGVNIIAAGSVTAGTVQTIIFSDSNGISFGMHSDSTVITAQHNAYSTSSQITGTFLARSEAHIRQIAASNSSYTSGSVLISGSNNVTVSYNASTILISGANTHGQQTGISAIEVSNTTYTAGTVKFVNSNNISFGSSGAGEVTASISFPKQAVWYSASGAEFSSSTLEFDDAGGVSFYLTNGSVAGSIVTNYLASQKDQRVSASNGSYSFETLHLIGSGAGNVYSTNGSSIVFSVPTQTPIAVSDSATSFAFQTLSLGTENGLTLYHSNSSIVGSYTVPDVTAVARVVSINGTSGSLSFSGSRNVTVESLNGSTISIVGPANILNSFSLGGNTGTTGSSAITGGGFLLAGGDNITLSQSNNTISIFGTGGIRLGASDTTYVTGTVFMSAGSNVTIGTTQNAGIQYIKIDAAGASNSAGADGYNILAAGAQTASTATTIFFSNGSGVSFGMNNNVITASIASTYVGTGYSSSSVTGTALLATHDTNGLSMLVPAWNTRTDYAGTGTTITGASVTLDTVGLQMNVPQGSLFYIDGGGVTWSANSSGLSTSIYATAAGGTGTGLSAMNYSASGTSTSTGTLVFGNSNGISFSISNDSLVGTVRTDYASSVHTHSQYLTTAMLSGASASFAGTSLSLSRYTSLGSVAAGVLNTLGLQLNLPYFLTTALASNAGTAFAGINTAQTNVTWTVNSSGISFNAGAYARTGVTTTTASVFSATLNTSGLRIEMPPYITNGVQASETTKFAGLGFTTGSTGGTAIVGTLSTNGLSIRVPNYGVDSHSLYFNDSNGITWGSSTAGSSTTITASIGIGSQYFANANATSGSNITFGSSIVGLNTTVYASAGGGTGGGVLSISAGTLSATRGSLVFSNSNSVSFGMSGSTITASVPIGIVHFSDTNGITWSSSTGVSNTTVYVGSMAGGTGGGGSFSAGVSTLGNSYGSTGTVSNQLVLVGGTNISLSQSSGASGATVTIIGPNPVATNLSISAGVSSGTYDRIVFSNSNNLSFGLNGSTITGSYSQSTHTHALTQYVGLLSTAITGGSATVNSSQLYINIPIGTLHFSDGSGVTWGSATNGLSTTVTASVERYSFSNIAGFSFVTSTYASVPGVVQVLLSTA